MDVTNNFSSYNGMVLPCSGNYNSSYFDSGYIDADGSIWMPCFCDTSSTGSTGTGGTGPRAPEAPTNGQLRESIENDGQFLRIGSPHGILYYPGETRRFGEELVNLGMLADADKGGRSLFRGQYSGRLRVSIQHENRTNSRAFLSSRGTLRYIREPLFGEGLPLRYGICFFSEKEPSSVKISRQGIGISTSAAPNFFQSDEKFSFSVNSGDLFWLFLGKNAFTHHLDESFVLTTQPGSRRFEALLDLEISGKITMFFCAFHNFAQIQKLQPLIQPEQLIAPSGRSFCGSSPAVALNQSLHFRLDSPDNEPLKVSSPEQKKPHFGWITHQSGPLPPYIAKDVFLPEKHLLPFFVKTNDIPYAALETQLFAPPLHENFVNHFHKKQLRTNRGRINHCVLALENPGDTEQYLYYYLVFLGKQNRNSTLFFPKINRLLPIFSQKKHNQPPKLILSCCVPANSTKILDFFLYSDDMLGHFLQLSPLTASDEG